MACDLWTPGLYEPQRPCRISLGGPCDTCMKIQEVELHILAAPSSFEDLLEQHRELRTEMNRKHDPIILRVPPEIASAIFQLCVPPLTAPSVSEILPSQFQRDVATRLVLGAVCHGWRLIAWSTPRLWNAVAIRLNSHLSWQPGFIQEWLDRSGGLPLAVSVYKPFRNSESDSYAYANALIDILNQYSNRWQILQLDRIPGAFYSLFRGNSSSTSILRSLELKPYKADVNGQFSIQNIIPRPEKVIIHALHLKSVFIAWDNVTSACVLGLPVHEYFELLRKARNIQHLTMDVLLIKEHVSPVPTGKVIQSQLRQLFINEYDMPNLAEFLQGVVFPELADLVIHSDDEDENFPLSFETVSSLLQRSACRLRVLNICGHFGSSDTVAFLEQIPSLEWLYLNPLSHSNHFPGKLFKRLAETSIPTASEISGDAAAFLPHLCYLGYRKNCAGAPDHLLKFPWDLLPRIFCPFSEMGNPRRPLCSVEIEFDLTEHEEYLPPIIDIEFLPPLLSILRAGLGLKIINLWYDDDLDKEVYISLHADGNWISTYS